ncbi:MAG TPA: CehA/McbA family metallohydrolase [Pseudonocardia sp.]|nr:CehA/McbA family metallohydrolase [Pseudonocardia sp.]
MCCAEEALLRLPAAVIEMLARYRRLRDEQGIGWGEDELPEFFRWARFSRLGPAFAEFAATGDWAGAVRTAVGERVPAGLVLIMVGGDGGLSARVGPPRPVVPGATVQLDVVIDSAAPRDLLVTVAGQEVPVPAGGAGFCVLDVGAEAPAVDVRCADAELVVADAVTPAAPATLRLTSPEGARWSILDHAGCAWFTTDVPSKWDSDDQPFFHTGPGTVELAVPAGPVRVTAARGLEFERQLFELDAAPGRAVELRYAARRRFDPAAAGWYGADLHVHLNYSGDHVLHPADAARMQRGEGLHLMQLAAGNLGGPLVYDLELLESTAGSDLWAADGTLARAGLEFRNDLLGHVHGLGLTAVPELRQTGHDGTDHPWDWPPNATACAQLRELGAITSYAHPVFSALDEPEDLCGPQRTVEARELVVDAALGLVDAMELISCFDDRGALVLYHHLLSCGLRLAAVAGTDTFLSFAHGPAPASNPPGWARVYGRLGPAGLSVAAFAEAVRAGETLVTNGPWLTLDVDGHGPGAVLDRAPGDRLHVRLGAVGGGTRLVLYGPDGELAGSEDDRLEHEVVVERGLWLAAAAHGDRDAHTLGSPVFAHTSPVYVDVAGRPVARAASARWCLRLLDGLQRLVTEHGRFDPARREQQLGSMIAIIEQARTVYRDVEEAAA